MAMDELVRAAIERSERKFDTVFNACPDLIAISSRANGVFRQVNDAFERIMGWSRDEVVGRSSLEINTWAVPEERIRMLAALGDRQRLSNFETVFRRKNGEPFTALMSLELFDLDDEPCLIIVARDISERKAEEEMLRHTAGELARSNLDLERFAYVAAHDLQEPCRTICSYAQLLERRYGDKLDADARDYLRFLSQGAQRMRDLVNGLLLHSRAGSQAFRQTEVDLEKVMAAVTDDLGAAIAAANAQVEVAALPRVVGDAPQLHQAFLNLVANGLKYQAPGTRPRVWVAAEPHERGWLLSVADNGIGIAAQHREEIFEPFRRLHGPASYSGAGIGLAVVKRVAENHGGSVRAEPREGGGTVFRFILPA